MGTNTHVMLDAQQLNETDKMILDTLGDDGGRMRPVHIADAVGKGRSYVSQRLKRLTEHGHIAQPYEGLYVIDNDPREVDDDE